MLAAIDLRVALISVLCLVAAGALGYLTWWFWQSAQPESPALAPLEIMSERRYRHANEVDRARMLDEARIDPSTAAPLAKRAPRGVSKPNDQALHEDDDSVDDGGWLDAAPIDPLLR
jgi:hypothetical protein